MQFEAPVEQARETFLAILGHDLRTPLGAIQASATFRPDTEAVTPAGRPLAAQIAGSARRAVALVGELLDFTRSRLGGGIPVVRAEEYLLTGAPGLFNPLRARGTRPVRAGAGPTDSRGLGLYIAERLVRAHGGSLAVVSDAARGTAFTATLPRD